MRDPNLSNPLRSGTESIIAYGSSLKPVGEKSVVCSLLRNTSPGLCGRSTFNPLVFYMYINLDLIYVNYIHL